MGLSVARSGLCALAGLATVALAGSFLAAEIRAFPLIEAAAALESANYLPTASERSRRIIDDAGRGPVECARRPLRARVAASLFLLERTIADGADLDARIARFTLSQNALREGLACSPLDGKFWALLASLDLLAAYEPNRYEALMRMSIETAPFEGGAIASRWSSLRNAPDLASLVAKPVFHDDLGHVLAWAEPATAARILDATERTEARAALTPLLLSLPDGRKDDLRRAAEKASLTESMAHLKRPDEARPTTADDCAVGTPGWRECRRR